MCRRRFLVVQSISCSKFHRESPDLLNIFKIFAIIFCFQQLWWHISLELWFFYSMSAAVKPPPEQACSCWAEYVNKTTKYGFFSCKNSFYVKTFLLLQKIMAKIMKILRRSEDSLWNFEHDVEWTTSERLRHKTSTT